MSRSNPTLDNTPHPCQRWHEWDGEHGVPRYYDKEKKETMNFTKPEFTFILLDQLSVIKGWHEPSESGITSNEVRDIGKDVLTVKAFKGGMLAQGIYSQIKDRVKACGGHFTANLYIAFKNGDGKLSLGALQLKGAALNAWVDFAKKNRAGLYTGAIKILGFTEGKKGKITFRTPKFFLAKVSDETNAEAIEVDKFLQDYLRSYFGRQTTQQVNTPAAAPEDEPPAEYEEAAAESAVAEIADAPF